MYFLTVVAVSGILIVVFVKRHKKEKRKTNYNVAYNAHDCEIKTDANETYNAVNHNIITTANAAYATTSVQSIKMSVVDITTAINEAYIATGCTSSAYGTAQTGDDNTTSYGPEADTTLEYDYPRQDI